MRTQTPKRRASWVLAWLVAAASAAWAEPDFAVSGRVRDAAGRGLAGASVVLDGGARSAQTDADGAFQLTAARGPHTLQVILAGYQTASRSFDLAGDTTLDVALTAPYRATEAVVVQAIRADEKTPISKTDIPLQAIAERNHGQEMPFLLAAAAPSLTFYSDSGIGAGYSYFYLRGIQQTRVNMTIDGVPLNDPEETAVYFSNFGDFGSALDSIQIQRGVGTSTVGAASYAGSVNFASAALSDDAALLGTLSGGSFGTYRGSLAAQSGRFGDGFALYGRASYQETDGFKHHSGITQHTFFLGAERRGERSLMKLFGFSGRERTELAFLATEQSVLEQDLRTNALDTAETDDFGQDLLHLQWTRFLGDSSSLALQGYYNGAQGWFRLWDDPLARTALLQYSIDGHFVGAMASFNHARNGWTLAAGAHANDFRRDHFMDVVGGSRAYLNTGFKREANAFLKLARDLGRWQLYGDAQLRHSRFRYEGDLPIGDIDWTFFNPKLGLRRELAAGVSAYLSVGQASREPARNDLFAGEDNPTLVYDLAAVKPERVTDFEAGLDYRRGSLELHANLYAMEFRDEIALTGELSEIGLPLRRNVDRSHRRGLELAASWAASPKLTLGLDANLSRNRIDAWTQFYDVYDAGGAWIGSDSQLHQDVQPLLTPELIASARAELRPARGLSLALAARYVARSFLDNTNQGSLETPSYLNLDATLSLALERWLRVGRPRLRLQVNNLLDDDRIWPSGYSYLYFVEDAGQRSLAGIPYYYPLATRSVLLMLDLEL